MAELHEYVVAVIQLPDHEDEPARAPLSLNVLAETVYEALDEAMRTPVEGWEKARAVKGERNAFESKQVQPPENKRN